MSRSTLWTVLLACAGLAALLVATEGARAFTSEGARRLEIARNPRTLPSALLDDATGVQLQAEALRGAPLIVGFVYTYCGTACPRLTQQLAELQSAMAQLPRARTARLLSVSFDPERDTPARLAEYAQHFGADPERWRFARISDAGQLKRWLEVFGIVVIPDGLGGYEHNAALHVVDARGRLVAIFEVSDVAGALAKVEELTR